jgi:hypothetical protein
MDLTFFRKQGYQVCRGVIPTEVVGSLKEFLVAEANTLLEELSRTFGTSTIPELCTEIDRRASGDAFKQMDQGMRSIISGHYPLQTRLSRRLWEVPRDGGLRTLLQEVLQDQVLFMHMPPTARFVLPRNRHAGVPAHQDVSYNSHMSEFVTVWVPFTPIDDDCGGVAVYEGSNTPVELLGEKVRGFWLPGVPTQGFHRVHCKMAPGDCLLLNRWVVHESVTNISERIRYSVDFRFFSRGENSAKHHLDLQSWEVIAPR